MSTSLLTLNIGAAGVARAERIWEWLGEMQPDTIVLTETSAGVGTAFLADNLKHHGYFVVDNQDPRDRGVLIAARGADHCIGTMLATPLPHRIAAVGIPSLITVMGVYVPSRDRSPLKVARKREFVEALLRTLGSIPQQTRDHLVLVGDYNTIARDHEPRLPNFLDWEYGMHDELARLGFASAHTQLEAQPYSWMGRAERGYLYDYVHAGQALALGNCRYLYETRDLGLSDHAAVAVTVDLATGLAVAA